jgi:hypothetical protein
MMAAGLTLFVVVIASFVVALLYDWWRVSNGLQSLTQYIRTHRWLMVPILLWLFLGGVGLYIHLTEN